MSTTAPVITFDELSTESTILRAASISLRRYPSARGICIRFLKDKNDIAEAKNSAKTIGDNGGYIQYILVTPIETALTAEEVQAFLALHTNKPYSTIFNSAGADQRIEYVADTKRYIDNKFTELQQAILSTGGNV